jgi:hypothetical protein
MSSIEEDPSILRFRHITSHISKDRTNSSTILHATGLALYGDKRPLPTDDPADNAEKIKVMMELFGKAVNQIVDSEEETGTQYSDADLLAAVMRAIEHIANKTMPPDLYNFAGAGIRN